MTNRKTRHDAVEVVEAKILKLTRYEFRTRKEIAEALNLSINTVRANYLYPMANRGILRRKLPKGTKAGQAYKASGR